MDGPFKALSAACHSLLSIQWRDKARMYLVMHSSGTLAGNAGLTLDKVLPVSGLDDFWEFINGNS